MRGLYLPHFDSNAEVISPTVHLALAASTDNSSKFLESSEQASSSAFSAILTLSWSLFFLTCASLSICSAITLRHGLTGSVMKSGQWSCGMIRYSPYSTSMPDTPMQA